MGPPHDESQHDHDKGEHGIPEVVEVEAYRLEPLKPRRNDGRR